MSKRLELIAALLFLPWLAHSATQITVTASNLSLSSPWSYVIDANNTPEGSWTIDGVLQSSASITVPLGQTLAAGNYSVFAKVLDLDHGNILNYTIGGTASGNQTFDDRDIATIYWTTNLPTHAAASFSSVTLNFTFTGAFNTQLRFIAFYLTSDTNEVVLRDDRSVPFHLVNAVDTTVEKGNLIPNSSFEGGVSRFWRMISSPVAGSPPRTYTLQDCLSTNDALYGQQSLHLGTTPDSSIYILESNPILCASNRIHSFSVWAKSSTGSSRVTLRVNSMYTEPSGATATFITNVSTTVSTSWTRVGLTNVFLPWYPNGQYYVIVETRQDSPGLGGVAYTAIDAVQLEEGGMSDYAPMYPFEAGPTLSERTQIIWTNEAPTVTIRAYNNSNGSITKRVDYTIYNWTNGIVQGGSANLTATASNFTSTSVSVPVTQRGHFRMTTSITNQASDDELTWVVVAPPASLLVDTNSYFGVHLNDDTNVMVRAQRLGAKVMRRFSLGRARWSEVELSEGVFTWPTFLVATNYGLVAMLNLGEDTPSWISPLTNNTNKFSNFVFAAVSHYFPLGISSYEIWNEPDQDGGEVPNMSHYARLLVVGSHAVKNACASCQVVGGGGVATFTQVTNIWALIGSVTSRVDVMSVHTYPPNEGNAQALAAFTAVPIWNTETGTTDKGGYSFVNTPFRSAGVFVLDWKSADTFYDHFVGNVSDQSRNLLTCLAWGYKRQFYYDGGQRNVEVYDFTSRQFTWLDYDDSIRAKGAMLAGVWSLLDKSTGFGSLMFSNLPCYAFMSANFTPMVACWANSNMTAVLSSSVNAIDLKVYDIMGNARTMPTLTLNFGRMPQIIENIGSVTFAQMCAGFSNAVVTARVDVTAPSLVTQPAKRHRQSDTFRAFAIDDSGVNDEDNTARLQYRYMVNSDPWSTWGGNAAFDYVSSSLPTVIWQTRDAAGNVTSSEDVSGVITNRTVTRVRIKGGMRIK